MLVLLSGVAGAGKDTLKRELLKTLDYTTTLPSYTTRSIRNGEVEGGTYHFVSKEEFKEMIANGDFYEYDIHHDNYYGTSKKLLNQKIESGKVIIKDIDVNGTENLVNLLSKDTKIVTIFLKVPKDELERRLKERIDNPSQEEINLRLSRFTYEESKMVNYDYVINNKDLQKTLNIVKAIIENEKIIK